MFYLHIAALRQSFHGVPHSTAPPPVQINTNRAVASGASGVAVCDFSHMHTSKPCQSVTQASHRLLVLLESLIHPS